MIEIENKLIEGFESLLALIELEFIENGN